MLLHAVKFTVKAQEAETWLAVAAMGITQPELKAALGYDFFHVLGRGGLASKLKPAGFTVPVLRAFCNISCVALVHGSYGFTLQELRETGVTVHMLLQEELRLSPDLTAAARQSTFHAGHFIRNHPHPQLALLSNFVSAGYSEAEVCAAARGTGAPVCRQKGFDYELI
jgi:hypothetical protein